MLRLIVMRHAKSDWATGAASDHERPLNPRGRDAAPKVARALVERGWEPSLVLSSDSARTTETYELMAPEFESEPQIEWRSDFYHGRPETITSALEQLDDTHSVVLVLGHNPGWEMFASELSGQSISMTTANAVLFQTDDDNWAEALAGSVFEVIDVIRPREL